MKFDFFEKFLPKQKGVMLVAFGIIIGLMLLFLDKNGLNTENYASTEENNESYITTLENRLENMINNIEGVSDTKVMITLKSSSEVIYALDKDENREKHVIVGNEPVYVKEYLPEIEGVAVICKGGNGAVIKEKITELLSSLLGIYSNHIYVTD